MGKANARKRRKRGAGRPRTPDAAREPNGRLSRQEAHREARQHESERATMGTVIDARMRLHRLTETQAKDRLAGSVLALLHFDRRVSEAEFKAGERYAEDMARYYSLTGIPSPNPRAQNLFAVRGHDGDESQSRAENAKAASNRFMALEGQLLSCSEGRMVKEKVWTVCVLNDMSARDWTPYTIGYVRRGLDRLAVYYGIGKARLTAAG